MNAHKISSVAVIIPCYNEGLAIGDVVKGFKRELPESVVYVYDNNSTDNSAEEAAKAGAIIRSEPLQGKGNVVRRMFADVEADIYVLADGDGACEPASAKKMVNIIQNEQADMVNGSRVHEDKAVYRIGHIMGNKALSGLVSFFFGNTVTDVLSGYRVFSRRFVKSFPAISSGFEIETELTVHALEMRMKISEVSTRLYPRVEGTESKLHTVRDGLRILRTIFILIKEERPLQFFSLIAVVMVICSVVVALPVVIDFFETSKVTRIPTLILSTGLMLLGFLFISSGLVLDTVTRGRREVKRLHYLSLPATKAPLSD